MHLTTLFALLACVSASRFFKGGKRSKTCNQAAEHQKLFEKMIVGEPLAKISAALTKSECVSLETLVEMLDEESKSWNDKQFLPVAETLAALAESDNISVGYKKAYEYILKAAQGDDPRELSTELLDSLDADNLMYGPLVLQRPQGYPFREPAVINDLLAIIDPQEQLSKTCREEVQEIGSWSWLLSDFNGSNLSLLKRCVADPTHREIIHDAVIAFEKASQLRLQAASRTLYFANKNLTDPKQEYLDILQRAKNYVSTVSNLLLQAAVDANTTDSSDVLRHVNAHFQTYPVNGLASKPARPSGPIRQATLTQSTWKSAKQSSQTRPTG